MSGRNFNVWITNWQDQGTTVPVPKWSVDIAVEWTKQDATPGSASVTKYFPNVLQGVPPKRIKQYMEEIILRELRLKLGINVEE